MIVLIINCPCMGILGASAKSFLLNFVANALSDHPENSIALLVHPNRASQQDGRTDYSKNCLLCSMMFRIPCSKERHACVFFLARKASVAKEEDDDMEDDHKDTMKKSESDDDDDEDKVKAREAESVEIRDVQYKLENLAPRKWFQLNSVFWHHIYSPHAHVQPEAHAKERSEYGGAWSEGSPTDLDLQPCLLARLVGH